MPTEAPEKTKLKPLSDVEKMEMEEAVRNRMQTPSISREAFAKNRPRYQRWFSKRLGLRIHITKSKRVAGDVVGESEIRPGLSIKFMGGELILDRHDPYYELITKRLREHHYFSLKHIVCVDDLDAEEKKRTTQSTIGVSQRHQLRAVGVMSAKQQNDILHVLNVKSTKEFDALATEAKGLKAENERLKDPKAAKDLVDLQAENKRLKEADAAKALEDAKAENKRLREQEEQARQLKDLLAENARLKEAGNDGNAIETGGGSSS